MDNIFSLYAIAQKYLSKESGRLYCIFIDFRRAFNSINHEKLWDSLKRKGIYSEGKFLNYFQSMYQQLKSCVKVSGGLTEFVESNIGTRQCCISSPIIFILFINDLVSYLKSECENGTFISDEIEDILALMFADDVASFADTVVRLQRQINLISRFCNSVGMSLNLSKTKIMVFRKEIERWFYQGIWIEIVPLYKYLGVYFTPKLKWTRTKPKRQHPVFLDIRKVLAISHR